MCFSCYAYGYVISALKVLVEPSQRHAGIGEFITGQVGRDPRQ